MGESSFESNQGFLALFFGYHLLMKVTVHRLNKKQTIFLTATHLHRHLYNVNNWLTCEQCTRPQEMHQNANSL